MFSKTLVSQTLKILYKFVTRKSSAIAGILFCFNIVFKKGKKWEMLLILQKKALKR